MASLASHEYYRDDMKQMPPLRSIAGPDGRGRAKGLALVMQTACSPTDACCSAARDLGFVTGFSVERKKKWFSNSQARWPM